MRPASLGLAVQGSRFWGAIACRRTFAWLREFVSSPASNDLVFVVRGDAAELHLRPLGLSRSTAALLRRERRGVPLTPLPLEGRRGSPKDSPNHAQHPSNATRAIPRSSRAFARMEFREAQWVGGGLVRFLTPDGGRFAVMKATSACVTLTDGWRAFELPRRPVPPPRPRDS